MEMRLLFFSFKYSATGRKCSPLHRISIGIPSGKALHLMPGLLCTQRLHSGVSCHSLRSQSKQQPITMPHKYIRFVYSVSLSNASRSLCTAPLHEPSVLLQKQICFLAADSHCVPDTRAAGFQAGRTADMQHFVDLVNRSVLPADGLRLQMIFWVEFCHDPNTESCRPCAGDFHGLMGKAQSSMPGSRQRRRNPCSAIPCSTADASFRPAGTSSGNRLFRRKSSTRSKPPDRSPILPACPAWRRTGKRHL
mgnify:CR=1 FL=1